MKKANDYKITKKTETKRLHIKAKYSEKKNFALSPVEEFKICEDEIKLKDRPESESMKAFNLLLCDIKI
jgi:hypothetical protein